MALSKPFLRSKHLDLLVGPTALGLFLEDARLLGNGVKLHLQLPKVVVKNAGDDPESSSSVLSAFFLHAIIYTKILLKL